MSRAIKINYYRSVRSESIIKALLKIIIARAIIMAPCDQNRYYCRPVQLDIYCPDHNYFRSDQNCYHHVRSEIF